MQKKLALQIIFLILAIYAATNPLTIQPANAQSTTIYVDATNAAGPWNGTLNFPYRNITSALSQASAGNTIFVRSGTYPEHIEINKTITLIGQNQTDTTIDGSGEAFIPIILITAPHATMANFTVKNTASDVETYGILVSNVKNITLSGNIITQTYRAMMISNSSQCRILKNKIMNNFAYGVSLRLEANLNLFTENNIVENSVGASLAVSCQNNTFYHNSFISNSVFQVDSINYGTHTNWNSSYPTGGNFWSDYTGTDLMHGPNQNLNGSDGIGDTPYVAGGARDCYPLMHPYISTPPTARFTYSPQYPVKNQTVTFNASASHDPDGNITSYQWNFGDGNTTTTTAQIATHRYLNYGNYTVTLAVTDNDGLTGIKTTILTVQKRNSTLSIHVNPSIIEIERSTLINGTLLVQGSQPRKNLEVTIDFRIQGQSDWTILATVTTSIEGIYSYNWTPPEVSTYEIKATWEGNETVLPADSLMTMLMVNKIKSVLTISVNHSSVTIGENVTISGKLTPAKEYANITISYQNPSFTWVALTTMKTDQAGSYLYDWKTIQTGVNFLKASWPGDELTAAAQNFTTVTVALISSNITIAADKSTAIVGTTIRIVGSLTPLVANTNVVIDIRTANGTRSWNATISTDANGGYEYEWTPNATGTYRIKATWQGGSVTMPAHSEEIEINIQPKGEIPLQQYVVGAVAVVAIFIVLAVVIRKTKKK